MLHYTIIDKTSSDCAPWILFLAGFTGTIDTWKAFCEHLPLSQFKILLIDNMGAGQSPQPKIQYTTDLMAYEIIKITYNLNVDKLILVGHSMGGAIAQKIAISAPQLIEHLFLLSSFSKLDLVARNFLIARYKLIEAGADKNLIALNIIPSLFGNQFLANEKNVHLAIEKIIHNPQTLTGLHGQLNACLTHDLRDDIDKIRCKTSIISGNNDVLVNVYHSKVLHEKIYNSTFDIIENSGHMVQLEQPEILAKLFINLMLNQSRYKT